MKESFIKIYALLITASCLAILTAIAAAFMDHKNTARTSLTKVVDTLDYTTIQSKDRNDEALSYGEFLFKDNCKSCHAVHTQEVGPALLGVSEKRSKKWIRQFIRDNEVLVRKKDTAAINLIKKFNYSPHTKFESLTDNEIDAIFQYIDQQPLALPKPKTIYCY